MVQDCQLSIHMRYGLVQVLNSALIMLSDEDCDVRKKAIDFASDLKVGPDRRARKVSRVKAIETLTLLGLDCFEDCAEYFLPITELSNVDWTLIDVERSSQLFESGEGINVYAETTFSTGIYFTVLMDWLRDKDQVLFRQVHYTYVLICQGLI